MGKSTQTLYWSYAEIADSASIDTVVNAFTLSVWINRVIAHADNRDETLVHRKKTYPAASAGLNDHFRLSLKGGKPEVYTDLKSLTSDATTPVVPAGSWHHIAATYDGSALSLYLDGVAVPGSPKIIGDVTLGNDTTALTLGVEDDNGTLTRWADVIHDELRIYNRSLSPAEIKTLSQ